MVENGSNGNASAGSRPLYGMFTVVTPRYDFINRVITLGMDARWRKLAAETCLAGNPGRILDIGCGTGDLSISIARQAGKGISITGLDYSPPMLTLAREKAIKAGVADRINFVQGDATRLPYPDEFFDVVGISFAFRNMTYQTPVREPHLAEVRRVLRPGGRYVITETSQPKNGLIRALCHLYERCFVAPAGILLSGNRGAYRYLAESARRFMNPAEVKEMLMKAGFSEVGYRPLFLGAAGIHVAVK